MSHFPNFLNSFLIVFLLKNHPLFQLLSMIQLSKLLSACVDLAQQAGNAIRLIQLSGHLDVNYKAVDDPLTAADLNSQRIIVGGLRAVWHDLSIIAEENIESPVASTLPNLEIVGNDFIPSHLQSIDPTEVIVFIDPLDATREFTQGKLECVTCLVGISKNGEAIAGVIHQPFFEERGRTIYGVVGGSHVLGLKDLKENERHKGTVLVTTASHNSKPVDIAIDLIKPDKVLRAGGAGYKSLLLMEKIVDVYVFPTPGCKLWDTCAPHALLAALGGTLTTPSGAKIQYSSTSEVSLTKGFIASLIHHDVYLKKMKDFEEIIKQG